MRRRLLGLALCAGLAVGLAPNAGAADCTGLPKHSNVPVVDAANVVPSAAEAYLVADLLRHQMAGNEVIVAVTVRTLGGDDVSSYARRLFDCWGIGDATSDNGILILVAIREQRVRIEAGAGFEGRLTEEQLHAAIDEMVVPLRKGDVGAGLRAAAVSVAAQLGGELPDTEAGTGGSVPSANPGDVEDGGTELPPGLDDELFDPIAGPYGSEPDSFNGLGALAVVVIVVGTITMVVRAMVKGFGGNGGGSVWRGGFPGPGAGGWGTPSMLRGGAWHMADAPSTSWSSGSSWSGGSSSGSSGGGSDSSGGSSFGGGSSGGGGASGSW